MKNFTGRGLVKYTARVVVAAGVGLIMDDVIANNTTPQVGLRKKLLYKAGASAIGGMVSNASKDYIGGIVDDTFALFDGAIEIVREVQNQSEPGFANEDTIQGEVVDPPTAS